ncbi:YesL family protein [Shouchella shacheensis]|uniref:YesL family protein n=1 Tax=Shouchella shacheensis TaxID=1649580 RepID=UPI00074041E5|nr:DUF624 domain-containing protein [Shouchella shacheensis]
METEGLRGMALRICDSIVRFASLNGLWILFSLLGGIVVGFFPATQAMYSIMREWHNGEKDIPLVRTFYREWKNSIMNANLIGYVFTVIGVILVLDLMVVASYEHVWAMIATVLIVCALFVYGLTALFLFPAMVSFEARLTEFLKSTLLLSLASLQYALLMIAALTVAFVLFIFVPPAAVCFGGSLCAWVTTHFSQKAFRRAGQVLQGEVVNQ